MSINANISISTLNELNKTINSRKKRILAEIYHCYLRNTSSVTLDELYKRYIDNSKIELKGKKQSRKKNINTETTTISINPNKCLARLWNPRSKIYYQCTRKSREDCSYCKIHILNRNYGKLIN